MKIKRVLSAVLCAAVIMSTLSACDKNKEKTTDSSSQSGVNNSKVEVSPVELKDYEFPEFLASQSRTDMLSNVVYYSFKESELVKEVTTQPFDDYDCKFCFFNEYYTFLDGNKIGLMNKSGEVIVDADKYSSAKLMSNNLIKFSYARDSGIPDEYFRVGNGHGSFVDDYKLSDDKIKIIESLDEETEKKTYQIWSNGKLAYDSKFESIEKISVDDIVSSSKPLAIYKATLSGQKYFITFDEFYNITVYEGVYGMIKLKIGNVYGECYILEYEDYSEITKMIQSFGEESSVSCPSKDKSLDFVQVMFGVGSEQVSQVTISSDGYCFADELLSDSKKDQPINKYFSVLTPETFVDVVNWISGALSEEYE